MWKFSLKIGPKAVTVVCLKGDIFHNRPKINKYLGYICKKIIQLDLSKMAQSWRTEC